MIPSLPMHAPGPGAEGCGLRWPKKPRIHSLAFFHTPLHAYIPWTGFPVHGMACPADRFLPARYLNPFFGVHTMVMVSGCFAPCPGKAGTVPEVRSAMIAEECRKSRPAVLAGVVDRKHRCGPSILSDPCHMIAEQQTHSIFLTHSFTGNLHKRNTF